MLQLAPCLSKIDLAQDIPILVQNRVEMITINDYPLFLDALKGRLVEIRRAFESAGIEVHSVHAPQDSLIAFDTEARTEGGQDLQKAPVSAFCDWGGNTGVSYRSDRE